MPEAEVQRIYDGLLHIHNLSEESVHRVAALGRESRMEIDVSTATIELQFVSRDTDHSVLRFLQQIAEIILNAEGEIQCDIVGNGQIRFEFFKIRGGKVFRQSGHILRTPEQEITGL